MYFTWIRKTESKLPKNTCSVWFRSRTKYILGIFWTRESLSSSDPIQDSIRYPKYQNILCILDIFRYLKYDFGITDNFFISRFGSSVRVSNFGFNFKFYKIYFRYSDKMLDIFVSSDQISRKMFGLLDI